MQINKIWLTEPWMDNLSWWLRGNVHAVPEQLPAWQHGSGFKCQVQLDNLCQDY